MWAKTQRAWGCPPLCGDHHSSSASARSLLYRGGSMSFALQRPFHRDVLGAFIIAVFSVIGGLWSIFLTLLKFRSSFTLVATPISTCRGSCSLALRDSWSELAGLPITIYGLAFFLVLLFLSSVSLLASRRFSRSSRPLMMALAWGGLLLSVSLALRARLVLGDWCELCTVLHLACLGIFLGAWIAVGRPSGPLRVFRRPWWRDPMTLLGALVLASVFAAATAVQLNLYREAVRDARERSLLLPAEFYLDRLPEPALLLPAEGEARVIGALFLDLSCSHCLAEYESFVGYYLDYAPSLEIAIYHFPVTRAGRPHNARSAAKALQCISGADSEHALEVVSEIFALQNTGAPFFKQAKLVEVAESHHMSAKELDLCMQDPQLDTMIRHHIEFGRTAGIEDAPGIIIGGLQGQALVEGEVLPGGLDTTFIEDKFNRILDSKPEEGLAL